MKLSFSPKLSTAALAAILGGGGKSIVHAEKCTEMSITGSNVNMNACLNIGIEACDQTNASCTKFGDLFGTGWTLLKDVTEQMADPNDETKGRLPAYTKMVKNTRMYLYYEVDAYLSDGSCGGGKWVFGTKVGAGKGIDWGQAGCGAVPSTCHVWGFGPNTGGYCDSSRIGDGTFDTDRHSDRSLPYQVDGITYSMKADGMSTKRFCSTYTCSCRSMSGLNGDGTQADESRDITFDFQCTSSSAATVSYEDVSGLERRPCLAEYTDFSDADGHYDIDVFTLWDVPVKFMTDDCRTSRCQGSSQDSGSDTLDPSTYPSILKGAERDCLDPDHYAPTCGCRTLGWVDRNITINGMSYASGNFELDSIADDLNLPDFGPSPSTSSSTAAPPEDTTTSSTTTTTTTTATQAMGTCVNAGSMNGESCSPDAAACGCTRRSLLDLEELYDQEKVERVKEVKGNKLRRQRELQKCKCNLDRGETCCRDGKICEYGPLGGSVCADPNPATTTTVPETSSTTTTTAQAECACMFGTTTTQSPPTTTTTTETPPQTTSSACAPAGANCREIGGNCCHGCQTSGPKSQRQCLPA